MRRRPLPYRERLSECCYLPVTVCRASSAALPVLRCLTLPTPQESFHSEPGHIHTTAGCKPTAYVGWRASISGGAGVRNAGRQCQANYACSSSHSFHKCCSYSPSLSACASCQDHSRLKPRQAASSHLSACIQLIITDGQKRTRTAGQEGPACSVIMICYVCPAIADLTKLAHLATRCHHTTC